MRHKDSILKNFRNSVYISLIFLIGNNFAHVQKIQAFENPLQDPPRSYDEIRSLESDALEEGNFGKLEGFVREHLKKAKKEGNNLEIARAFYYKTIIEEPSHALLYADSIVIVTTDLNHPNYPTLGYSLKGHLLYNEGNFRASLENYLTAYHLALKKENFKQVREISLAIAAIRNIKGQHYAAAELYKKSLHLIEKEKDPATNYEELITLLYNLSLTHLRLMELDSAKFYFKIGFRNVLAAQDKVSMKDFALLDAQINYYNKDFKLSRDTLLKYVDSFEGTEKAIKLYYLGKIEGEIGVKEKAFKYFEKIDSIVSETKDPFEEIIDVYQQLIMFSILEENKRMQVEYIEKLIHNDSILSIGREEILNETTRSFDIPLLKYQKKKVEEQLKAKDTSILLVTVLAGIGILSGFHFRTKAKRSRKKLQILIEKGVLTETEVKKKTIESPASTIPEDIRIDILEKLKSFENSDRYLDKDLDLAILAQELGTNTSYLSGTINYHKKLSFPNYLKDLRITKAIEGLRGDPELLKYNYQGLADTFGFKTGESFSKAFRQKTGVHPSKFLIELKSRRMGRDL